MGKNEIDVLLVEDDLSQVTLGIIAIEAANKSRTSGRPMRVEVARNGEEAIDLLKKQAFHLVLLDLRMPKIDGFEVLQFIKSADRLKRTPVIVMTTSDLDLDIKAALDGYANAYMVKPLNQAKMIDLMANMRNFWGSDEVRFPR